MTDKQDRREEIASEIAAAQAALARAQEIDRENEVLSRGESENLSVPSGRLRSVQNSLPDPPNANSEPQQ